MSILSTILTYLFFIFLYSLFLGAFYFSTHMKSNVVFGYRTSSSLKSEESWKYAQKKAYKTSKILFIVMAIITAISDAIFYYIEKDIEFLFEYNIVLFVIFLIALIAQVEYDLRKEFK